MKRYFSVVYFCVFLFSSTGYADDVTMPYKISGLEGVYTGEFLDGHPNGQGTYTFRSGSKYIGEFKDGLFHGQGTLNFIYSREKYVGQWKDGSQHGQGAYTYADGAQYVGQWKDGRKHGQGTSTHSDGSKVIGEFRNDGVFSGVRYDKEGNVVKTIVLFRGGVYVGEEVDGIPNGYGTFTTTATESKIPGAFYATAGVEQFEYVGEFKDGVYHGQGTHTNSNGEKYVGEYKEGVKHGQGAYTYADGSQYVGQWKDGKRQDQVERLEDISVSYPIKGYSPKDGYWIGNLDQDGGISGEGTWVSYDDEYKYIYIGEWKNGKFHGEGRWEEITAENWYQGSFLDGYFSGQGTMTWWDGSKYVGYWKEGLFHGQGVWTWLPSDKFPSGSFEKGEFKEGKLWNGVGEVIGDEFCHLSGKVRKGKRLSPTCTVHYDNGSRYVGEVNLLGQPHGHGVRESPDGFKYVGEWEHDTATGYGSIKFSDGATYVGDVYDMQPHGHGAFTYADGTQYVGEWKEFKEHGYGVLTQADGRVFSGEWTEGEYCPKCKRDKDNAHAARQRGDHHEVIRLLLPYAEEGHVAAQFNIGVSYGDIGQQSEAAKWYLRAAEQGYAPAQYNLALRYMRGEGVQLNQTVGIKLLEQALYQKMGEAAWALSTIYWEGRGVPQDRSVAYAYQSIAAALGVERAEYIFDLEDEYNRVLQKSFYPDYVVAQGQVIAREIWANIEAYGFDRSGAGPDGSTEGAISTGSGFFINDLGYVVTNSHVVNGCDEIHTVLNDEKVTSFIVINDVKNDLAVLKTGVEPASIAYFRSGRGIRAGEDVLAFGYPLQSVLSDDLKGTKGMVNALSGMNNDTRMMQISAPVQPGNSGGPLLDQAGNIVGVVTAKMDAIVMAQLTDDIAQNVNFALKASLVRDMLEVKEIDYETASSKEEQNTADIFEQAKKFTVLIECHH